MVDVKAKVKIGVKLIPLLRINTVQSKRLKSNIIEMDFMINLGKLDPISRFTLCQDKDGDSFKKFIYEFLGREPFKMELDKEIEKVIENLKREYGITSSITRNLGTFNYRNADGRFGMCVYDDGIYLIDCIFYGLEDTSDIIIEKI